MLPNVSKDEATEGETYAPTKFKSFELNFEKIESYAELAVVSKSMQKSELGFIFKYVVSVVVQLPYAASIVGLFVTGINPEPKIFNLPIAKPPWGRITAIDLVTGKHQWSIANGDTPQHIKDNPALDGIDLPRTGKSTRSGILVTDTLLFAGEGFGGEPVFRAHNKYTGEIVAQISLPATQTSPPSSYRLNGKQYIVMTVSDGKNPAELIALSLTY